MQHSLIMSKPALSLKMLKGKKSTGKRVLKLFTDEDNDSAQNWLPQKVAELSKDKLWKNCVILYWIPVTRKDKLQVKSRSDRYLFVFYNAEQSDGFLLNISCRDKEIDFKKSWPLSDIKSVEFQENSNMFKVSLEHDYIWNTTSNIERDEVIWVLIHVCKHLCSNDIKVKSSMGIKLLGLALTTNKTLSKFTLLCKLLDENMDTEYRDLLGNDLLTFTPEETDAENLFDELHWGSSEAEGGNGDPAQLQKCLHDETDALFVEICDFLLQWEEDDEKDAMFKGYKGKDAGASNSSSVRETFELLTSLDNVDASLESVAGWLSEQVDYLSDVQSQLHQIESENSGLETSWHNLTAVKAMITSLLNGPLSLDAAHESILRQPQKILQVALHEEKTLQNTSRIIAPLVNAISSLRSGLEKVEGRDCEFTPAEWRQIEAMSVVSEHRQKLRQLTSDVCTGLVDFSQSLFKTLVLHKCLTDEKYGGKPVRRFSFTTVVNSVKVAQGNFKAFHAQDSNISTGNGDELEGTHHSGHSGVPPTDSKSTEESNSEVTFVPSKVIESDNVMNQMAIMQRQYHHAIYPFFTLMENLSELSPSLQENLRESYITYTEKHMFSSQFKDLFREMIDLLPPHHAKELTLSTMPKCLAKKLTSPPLRFQHPSICRSGSPLVLSPWTMFSSVVRLADEVVHNEHIFLYRTILQLEKNTIGHQTGETKKGAVALSKLFAVLKEKLLKLVSSTEYTDGVEIIAMLVTVHMMIAHRTSFPVQSENLKIWNISMDEIELDWDFMEEMLIECKAVLSQRLDAFVASQLVAFRERKIDPKKTGVFSPVARFPAFIDQLIVFSGSKNFDFVDDALEDIGAELMAWVQNVAIKNEKYCDVILIHNLEFMVESLSVRSDVIALHQLCAQAQLDKEAAEKRYIKWMIAYEFPTYASLAERIVDLGRRATADQLGLYIRREDVSKAVTKMDKKHVEHAVTAIRKRLDKHFHASADVAGLTTLVPKLWGLLRSELSNVFGVIERVASECYQINLIVDETFVIDYCKKIP